MLPPNSPELDLVENFPPFKRNNRRLNHIFNSYEYIVGQRFEASRMLLRQPWRILSIG